MDKELNLLTKSTDHLSTDYDFSALVYTFQKYLDTSGFTVCGDSNPIANNNEISKYELLLPVESSVFDSSYYFEQLSIYLNSLFRTFLSQLKINQVDYCCYWVNRLLRISVSFLPYCSSVKYEVSFDNPYISEFPVSIFLINKSCVFLLSVKNCHNTIMKKLRDYKK